MTAEPENTVPGRSEGTARHGSPDLEPPAPIHRLTVLYDADCPLCTALCDWLARQQTLVAVDLLPADSPRAHNRFPELDHAATLRELTVVGGGGEVWSGAAAWVTVAWALRAYRGLSHRLATPMGMPVARAAVLAAARIRAVTRSEPLPPYPYADPYREPWTVVACADRCEIEH
ncbi:DCC1-like thiol-disulfide oxidoreductase family protein [Embleya sp. NPDC008237]|uniref:DCC1-like thiol-disulfide oxidoreductase family protein n=1 Tax=Embleya sp. NPDC008237 TaxID=3363978 RepID=UPI0036E5A768